MPQTINETVTQRASMEASSALVPVAVPAPVPAVRKRSLAARLWKHRWFCLFTLLVIGGGVFASVRAIIGTAVVVDRAQRGALVETVVASGHVESPYRVEIGSQVTGTVADVLVGEGEHVMSGQPLIALDARELQAAYAQAQGAVAQAESRLRQLKELTLPAAKEALSQAQATARNAQQTYDRTNALAQNDFATRAALDDARKNLDVALNAVHTAELQVFSASPDGSDYLTALTQLNQAKANQDSAYSRLSYATIAAPRDGVLISRDVERGAVVQPGKALLVLAPNGDTQLVLEVDERNLGKIALGQKALASADAYPDKRFTAIVSYINPGIDLSRASVEVKLTVPNPPDYLRQDMTVSVDVEVARSDGTLSVPARAVHDALSGAPWVMTVRDHRAVRQPVKTGLVGNARAGIVEGLADGAIVIPATSGIREGQRVRPILR